MPAPAASRPSFLANRWLAVALAAAVLVAGTGTVTARTIVGRAVTVSGTVVDARTDKPVAGASVRTGGDHPAQQRTNGAGRFRIHEVPRGSTVRVTAANYHPATAGATDEPIRMKLRPIPVTGSVTSSFTSKGLQATLSGKVNHKTNADGRFTVFGVGPGDKLTVSAFAHASTTITIGGDRKVSVALGLGRIDPDQVLSAPAGYGIVNAPPDVIAALRADIASGDPEFSRHITGMAMKSVLHNGEGIAIAAAVAVEPEWAALPAARDGFFAGFEDGSTSAKRIPLGGLTVSRAEGEGLVGYAWQRYAAFVFVLGEDAQEVETIARAMILGTATAST